MTFSCIKLYMDRSKINFIFIYLHTYYSVANEKKPPLGRPLHTFLQGSDNTVTAARELWRETSFQCTRNLVRFAKTLYNRAIPKF